MPNEVTNPNDGGFVAPIMPAATTPTEPKVSIFEKELEYKNKDKENKELLKELNEISPPPREYKND